MTDHDRLLGQLRTIRTNAQGTAERIGAPGCAARLRAADDVAALDAALALLSAPPVAWRGEDAHGLPAVTLSPAVRDDWRRYGRPVTDLYER